MRRFLCWLIGHKPYMPERMPSLFDRIYCRRCGVFLGVVEIDAPKVPR